jgi:hypothetical protein
VSVTFGFDAPNPGSRSVVGHSNLDGECQERTLSQRTVFLDHSLNIDALQQSYLLIAVLFSKSFEMLRRTR